MWDWRALWTRWDPPASDPIEERKEEMSSLVAGFAAWMCKRAASAQGETTLGFEVSGEKCLRQFGPGENALKSPSVITVDSPE